jgi:hypothetical protein
LSCDNFVTMRFLKLTVAVCCLLLGVFPFASAQDTRGQIIGRVTDPSGAVVAGAKVTGLHLETGVKAAVTDWTEANHLRHARFLALQDDKNALSVVHER